MYGEFIFIGGTTIIVLTIYLLFARKVSIHRTAVQEDIGHIKQKLKDVEERNIVFESEMIAMKQLIRDLSEELERYRFLVNQEKLILDEVVEVFEQ
jgi:hypothetical protein